MGKITTAVFEPGSTTANVYGLWQYDYGQTLRIQGLHLPSAVEIHFSLQETGGTSVSRVGVTKDGVTDVVIPDSVLENDGADKTYDMFAFVYLTDATSGQTEYKIKLQVKSRPKPEVPGGGENPNIFHEAVQAVQKSADKAAESEKQAEGWAHGREDLPERAQDNAKYYSDQTAADAKKTEADRKEVERLVESVSGIDEQVTKVENLTKQAQTSATNAALSEQAAKTAETNAQTAQAGAETAEGNAELAEQGAKASEQAVEKAKQLVTQMGQEVLNNRNHVDQAVQAFTLTAQQAVADVNNAGQTQTERVQSAGNTAVESVKTAQTEAVEAVQTAGTTQTGNVSAEGEKQIQAVQAAAQEIVADREQIAQNKAGIEALKQGKADAIIDSASGENITLTDSDAEPFQGLRVFGRSTQDGTPTPESPVPIVSAGDKGTVEVKITGKNLYKTYGISCFNIPNIASDRVIKNKYGTSINTTEPTEKIVVTQSAAPNSSEPCSYENGYFCIGIDNLEINKEYLFLSDVKINNNPLNVRELAIMTNGKSKAKIIIENNRLTGKFTYKENGDSQYLEIRNSGCSIELTNIMIIDTSFANNTSYEAYRIPQSLTLATPNGLPGIKVDKDGNYTDKNGQQWICDEIDLERGKYVQRIEKNVYNGNGTELWTYDNENSLFYIKPPNMKTASELMCDRYTENNKDASITTKRGSTESIFITDLSYTTLDDFKNGLAKRPLTVRFILSTPIETDLDSETIKTYKALHTNYPTTVISNDESAHMEVSYVADTKNYIVSKIETPLQKQITDLQNALISQKISGGGIKVTDSARVPVIKLSMWGKTEQVKTTGAQLFDASKIPTIEEGEITLKYDGNGSLILNGKGHVNVKYDYSHETTAKLLKPGKLTFLDKNNNNIGFMQACIFVDGKEVRTAYINGNAISLPEEELNNPTTFLRLLCYTIQSDATYNNVIFKPMLYQDGNGEWEPFTDGKPAPTPDNPAPIEVTAHPVTVTIKGGAEQQSVTLVPPRPMTKWDKLEKVDGVWRWVYKSDKEIFDGSEDEGWNFTGVQDPDKKRFFSRYISSNVKPCKTNVAPNIFCTHYNAISADIMWGSMEEGITVQGDRNLYVYNSKYAESSVEEFVKSLANNPITVYYESVDTEYIPLPQPVQDKLNALTMYAGTTEIANDGGCTMELTYTVDTKSYVDTKIAEISKAIL